MDLSARLERESYRVGTENASNGGERMNKKEFLIEQISQVIDKCAHDEDELFHFESCLINCLVQVGHRPSDCDMELCSVVYPYMERDCYTCWRNVLNEKEKD